MRAIDLLLDIGDVSAAASAVTDVGRALIQTPGGRVPRSWLSRFDADQLASEPWLALLSGLAAIEDGDIGSAAGLLAPVVDAMRDQQDRTGLVRSAYGLAETHLARGEVAEAATLIDELVRIDTTPDERVKVLMGQLWLDYFGGDWAAVGAGLDEAFTLAFTSCAELGRCTLALGLGTEFLFGPRGAQWLHDHCVELALRIRSDAMAATSLEVIQAAAHLIGGDVSSAEELAEGIDERALELGSLNWLAMASDRVRLGLALAQGDHQRLDTIVDAARQVFGSSDRHHQERAMYAYATARSGWLAGRPARVRAASVLLGSVDPQDRPDTTVTAAVIASMVHRQEGDVAAAEQALLEVRDLHHVTRFCLVTGLVDLELASIYLGQGRATDAVEAARPGLRSLARLDGVGLLALDGADTHRAVLDACRHDPELAPFAGRALDRLGRPVDSGGVVVPDTMARLTVRELDVIRQVMTGASNREVGERLFIGERTVKSHMTSLMRKLNVTSRTAAIARAHELGIS
ncbi:MAG: LuxR C-terminal-related transcriptional regulator [Microthrixaceae bacterium]